MTTKDRYLSKGLRLDQIGDPGNGSAIPVQRDGYLEIATVGAETRTLAAPVAISQLLLLYMIVDGGDCVISTAPAVKVNGNNRITFTAVGQYILLIGIHNGTQFVWRVCGIDGPTLTTV